MNGRAVSSTRWWWVRHAPVPNREGRILGQLDVSADVSDAALLRAVALVLPRDSAWIVSPLRRARETAEAIRAMIPDSLSEPEVEADLAEQNYGIWQGMTPTEIAAAGGFGDDAPWQRMAMATPPEGESFADLAARTAGAIRRLTHRHRGRDIVAVAHAGTIRAAIGFALGIEPEAVLSLLIGHLSLTRLEHRPLPGGEGGPRGWDWRVGPVGQSPTAFPSLR